MITRLQADLEDALVSRDNVRAHVLREALSTCKREALHMGLSPMELLSAPEASAVLLRMVRNREERIEHQGSIDAADWVARDLAEIGILNQYLGSHPPSHADSLDNQVYSGLHRLDRRVNVGPDYTLEFFLQGEAFRDIRITNLSAGGCCVQLAPELAELVKKGSRLHNLVLHHPGLPDTPQFAEVIYLLGKQALLRHPGKGMGFVLAGLHFLNAAQEFQAQVSLHVEGKLESAGGFAGPKRPERIPRCTTEEPAFEQVEVGPDHTTRFFLLDHEFQEVRILNLSAGGCCLQLDPEQVELMKQGDRLHNLSLCHPDLPGTPQHCQVVYLLGREETLRRTGQDRGHALAGIKFLHPKADFQEWLSRYVRAKLREALDQGIQG